MIWYAGNTRNSYNSSGLLILRNLLKRKRAPENPAYRPVRHFFFCFQ